MNRDINHIPLTSVVISLVNTKQEPPTKLEDTPDLGPISSQIFRMSWIMMAEAPQHLVTTVLCLDINLHICDTAMVCVATKARPLARETSRTRLPLDILRSIDRDREQSSHETTPVWSPRPKTHLSRGMAARNPQLCNLQSMNIADNRDAQSRLEGSIARLHTVNVHYPLCRKRRAGTKRMHGWVWQ
jgi:hypothetical protein